MIHRWYQHFQGSLHLQGTGGSRFLPTTVTYQNYEFLKAMVILYLLPPTKRDGVNNE